jgi:hypothetical protein
LYTAFALSVDDLLYLSQIITEDPSGGVGVVSRYFHFPDCCRIVADQPGTCCSKLNTCHFLICGKEIRSIQAAQGY